MPPNGIRVVRALVFDGEAFFRFVQDDRLPGRFNIELVDAGRVTSETFGASFDENVLDGVRYDAFGRVVSYTIGRMPVNPLYSGMPVEFEQVSANEILHLFIPDDSSNYNYSSGRLDHQTFFRYVETIQQRLTYLLDAMLGKAGVHSDGSA